MRVNGKEGEVKRDISSQYIGAEIAAGRPGRSIGAAQILPSWLISVPFLAAAARALGVRGGGAGNVRSMAVIGGGTTDTGGDVRPWIGQHPGRAGIILDL